MELADGAESVPLADLRPLWAVVTSQRARGPDGQR